MNGHYNYKYSRPTNTGLGATPAIARPIKFIKSPDRWIFDVGSVEIVVISGDRIITGAADPSKTAWFLIDIKYRSIVTALGNYWYITRSAFDGLRLCGGRHSWGCESLPLTTADRDFMRAKVAEVLNL